MQLNGWIKQWSGVLFQIYKQFFRQKCFILCHFSHFMLTRAQYESIKKNHSSFKNVELLNSGRIGSGKTCGIFIKYMLYTFDSWSLDLILIPVLISLRTCPGLIRIYNRPVCVLKVRILISRIQIVKKLWRPSCIHYLNEKGCRILMLAIKGFGAPERLD